jgi:Ni,Fe-hydrogenase III component G
MRHLLLMDDWPEGKFPLRRSYKGIDGKGGF